MAGGRNIAFAIAAFASRAAAKGSVFPQKHHGNMTERLRSKLTDAPSDYWSLNAPDGPYCDPELVPAWETPGDPDQFNGGWDICCYFAGCEIETAFWDPPPAGPLQTGQWCDGDFGRDHGTCWDEENQFWQFWANGWVYDDCGCVMGDDGSGPQDWKQIWADGDDGDAWLAGQCDSARPICYDGGYINNLMVQEKQFGTCNPSHREEQWDWGAGYTEGICYPEGQFCVDSGGNDFDC